MKSRGPHAVAHGDPAAMFSPGFPGPSPGPNIYTVLQEYPWMTEGRGRWQGPVTRNPTSRFGPRVGLGCCAQLQGLSSQTRTCTSTHTGTHSFTNHPSTHSHIAYTHRRTSPTFTVIRVHTHSQIKHTCFHIHTSHTHTDTLPPHSSRVCTHSLTGMHIPSTLSHTHTQEQVCRHSHCCSHIFRYSQIFPISIHTDR